MLLHRARARVCYLNAARFENVIEMKEFSPGGEIPREVFMCTRRYRRNILRAFPNRRHSFSRARLSRPRDFFLLFTGRDAEFIGGEI